MKQALKSKFNELAQPTGDGVRSAALHDVVNRATDEIASSSSEHPSRLHTRALGKAHRMSTLAVVHDRLVSQPRSGRNSANTEPACAFAERSQPHASDAPEPSTPSAPSHSELAPTSRKRKGASRKSRQSVDLQQNNPRLFKGKSTRKKRKANDAIASDCTKAGKLAVAYAAEAAHNRGVGDLESRREDDELADRFEAGVAPKLPWKGRKGQQFKKGPFSKDERETLERAASRLAEEYGRNSSDRSWLLDRRSKKHGDGGKDVWNELAAALPHRSPKQVWAYGNRHWNPGNFKGPWTAVEEEMLRQHVAANGSKWAEAGRKIGRMPESCRDKWRMMRTEHNKGRWTKAEEQKLYRLVQEQISREKGGKSSESGLSGHEKVNWEEVAKEHGTRNRYQCLQKWYDSLQPSMEQTGEWQAGNDLSLLKSLAREVKKGRSEWQVDWEKMQVPGADGEKARKRWTRIVRDIPSNRDMSLEAKLRFALDEFGGAELRDFVLGPEHCQKVSK